MGMHEARHKGTPSFSYLIPTFSLKSTLMWCSFLLLPTVNKQSYESFDGHLLGRTILLIVREENMSTKMEINSVRQSLTLSRFSLSDEAGCNFKREMFDQSTNFSLNNTVSPFPVTLPTKVQSGRLVPFTGIFGWAVKIMMQRVEERKCDSD